jgi:urease accessory protein
MLHATSILRKAELEGGHPLDSVTLDHANRSRRRIVLKTDGGRELMLDLPQASCLAHGDGLATADGEYVLVKAAAEALMEIRAASPLDLMRIAWHLGNRHVPAEITPQAIYIERDHVLGAMAERLGARVVLVSRPFAPEAGAYGGQGHSHGDHSHADVDHGR